MPLPGKLSPAMDFHIVLSRWVLQLLQEYHVSGLGNLIAILHVFPRSTWYEQTTVRLPCELVCIRGATQRYIGVGRSVVPVLERQRGKCCHTLRFRPQYSGGCLRSEATYHVKVSAVEPAITCNFHLFAVSVILSQSVLMVFRFYCPLRFVFLTVATERVFCSPRNSCPARTWHQVLRFGRTTKRFGGWAALQSWNIIVMCTCGCS